MSPNHVSERNTITTHSYHVYKKEVTRDRKIIHLPAVNQIKLPSFIWKRSVHLAMGLSQALSV